MSSKNAIIATSPVRTRRREWLGLARAKKPKERRRVGDGSITEIVRDEHYLLRWFEPDPASGKKRQRSHHFYGTERQANDELRRILVAVADGKEQPGGNRMTLVELAEEYLAYVGKRTRSEHTTATAIRSGSMCCPPWGKSQSAGSPRNRSGISWRSRSTSRSRAKRKTPAGMIRSNSIPGARSSTFRWFSTPCSIRYRSQIRR